MAGRVAMISAMCGTRSPIPIAAGIASAPSLPDIIAPARPRLGSGLGLGAGTLDLAAGADRHVDPDLGSLARFASPAQEWLLEAAQSFLPAALMP